MKNKLTKINQKAEEDLVNQYSALVKKIGHYIFHHTRKTIFLEDLIQVGMIGLLEASKQYDGSKGTSFETYASIRIRGHMLDEIRRNDWTPRSVYQSIRRVNKAVRKVENRLGKIANSQEIARELALDINQYHQLACESVTAQWLYIDEKSDAAWQEDLKHSSLDEHVLSEDLSNYFKKLITQLPIKEKSVLTLYYQRDFNLKEIGLILNISESRVSQLHSQALKRMRQWANVDVSLN